MLNKLNADYITEIAEYRNITKAAEKLYISQSSLSRYIINLEKEMKVKLFDRSVTPLQITQAGQLLLAYIRENELMKSELLGKLAKIRLEKQTTIRVGIVPWRVPIFLPMVIPAYKKQSHAIDVEIYEGVSQQLEEYLLNDKIDLCIINGEPKDCFLQYKQLNSEKVIMMIPLNYRFKGMGSEQNHYLHNDGTVCLEKLEEEKFILLHEHYRLGSISRKIFQAHHINPRNITFADSMTTAISMASVGLGLTFIPESAVSIPVEHPAHCLYCSIGEPAFYFSLIMAYKEKHYNVGYIRSFIDFVHENYHLYP